MNTRTTQDHYEPGKLGDVMFLFLFPKQKQAIYGLAGLSNNIADRHATAKHPKKHHAKIVVNSTMILSEFLLESRKPFPLLAPT